MTVYTVSQLPLPTESFVDNQGRLTPNAYRWLNSVQEVLLNNFNYNGLQFPGLGDSTTSGSDILNADAADGVTFYDVNSSNFCGKKNGTIEIFQTVPSSFKT